MRPSPHEWRDTVAEALDDPELQLGYRDLVGGGFREHDGRELAPPSTGRSWVPIDRADQPVAAMVLDETLAEDPELVRAAATATRVAIENGALEGEVRETRARILRAGDAERRRIELELHDGAQQRLIALRIHLTLAGEQLEDRLDRATLERLDSQVEEAIKALRDVAQGALGANLRERGPGAALADAAAQAPIPVRLEIQGLTRQAEALEAALYFCCLECLQNVAKHAGAGAAATVTVTQHSDRVRFSVSDDGAGFDPDAVRYGAGLGNLRERVTALGGELRVDARPGHGTRVTGTMPLQGS